MLQHLYEILSYLPPMYILEFERTNRVIYNKLFKNPYFLTETLAQDRPKLTYKELKQILIQPIISNNVAWLISSREFFFCPNRFWNHRKKHVWYFPCCRTIFCCDGCHDCESNHKFPLYYFGDGYKMCVVCKHKSPAPDPACP